MAWEEEFCNDEQASVCVCLLSPATNFAATWNHKFDIETILMLAYDTKTIFKLSDKTKEMYLKPYIWRPSIYLGSYEKN